MISWKNLIFVLKTSFSKPFAGVENGLHIDGLREQRVYVERQILKSSA